MFVLSNNKDVNHLQELNNQIIKCLSVQFHLILVLIKQRLHALSCESIKLFHNGLGHLKKHVLQTILKNLPERFPII